MDIGARLARQEGCLDELLEALGVVWTDPADPRVAAFAEREPHYPQYHRVGHKRQSAVQALTGNRPLVERHYTSVLRALVSDDDPSSPRWLAAVLVAAVGRRRVQESLVQAVEAGDPYQQVCAAGAWTWVQAPLAHASEQDLRAGRPTPAGLAAREALADVRERYLSALRAARAACRDGWARGQLAGRAAG
ncbi:hypothetical protein ACFC1R_12015 [Kitasatospora sp. NPDC056138]|uniref:hypothetical protein n=1 Tax=Kitasatospora sp. NPDC056138 TaxID=3345724 RepID=UPI0035E04D43